MKLSSGNFEFEIIILPREENGKFLKNRLVKIICLNLFRFFKKQKSRRKSFFQETRIKAQCSLGKSKKQQS